MSLSSWLTKHVDSSNIGKDLVSSMNGTIINHILGFSFSVKSDGGSMLEPVSFFLNICSTDVQSSISNKQMLALEVSVDDGSVFTDGWSILESKNSLDGDHVEDNVVL